MAEEINYTKEATLTNPDGTTTTTRVGLSRNEALGLTPEQIERQRGFAKAKRDAKRNLEAGMLYLFWDPKTRKNTGDRVVLPGAWPMQCSERGE